MNESERDMLVTTLYQLKIRHLTRTTETGLHAVLNDLKNMLLGVYGFIGLSENKYYFVHEEINYQLWRDAGDYYTKKAFHEACASAFIELFGKDFDLITPLDLGPFIRFNGIVEKFFK